MKDRSTTLKEKDEFIESLKSECLGDENIFNQEYMCVPFDASGEEWLSLKELHKITALATAEYKGGRCILGHDVAIRGDRSVVTVFELQEEKALNSKAVLVDLKVMKNATFFEQEQVIRNLFNQYKVQTMYVDQSGLGEKVVEDYKRVFGNRSVQGVIFTLQSKHKMAVNAKILMQNNQVVIPQGPNQQAVIKDLQKIKYTASEVNHLPKYTTTKDSSGHGDIAWSVLLALLGLEKPYQLYAFESVVKSNFEFNNTGI